ncbi:sugar phosphate isomerase/epimerase [Candidatus Sumerlaeota bacterium]|nr:sugar phosphate isomerase/epimerase [Candidatus Sumerlaeota bacterium]
MNRRQMLCSLAAGGLSPFVAGAAGSRKTKLGICVESSRARAKMPRPDKQLPLADPLNYLEYCHSLGAGGIQVALRKQDEAYCSKLRRKAEEYGMFIEGMSSLPRDKSDIGRFEDEVRTAKQAGADVIRVTLVSGRRYENYDSDDHFRREVSKAIESARMAEPVAARHRIRLAIENHKDHRIGERLDMLKQLNSEYLGLCLDTGNNVAMLEDPMEVVEAFAPHAFTVHLKDAAVKESENGFLLIDLPLGEGFLDLPRMVQVIRKVKPGIRFTLELITRNPLEVPCLTDKYWAAMSEVPGRDLARTLRMVRANTHRKPLPRISEMPLDELVGLEEENIKRSLAYAREHLGL